MHLPHITQPLNVGLFHRNSERPWTKQTQSPRTTSSIVAILQSRGNDRSKLSSVQRESLFAPYAISGTNCILKEFKCITTRHVDVTWLRDKEMSSSSSLQNEEDREGDGGSSSSSLQNEVELELPFYMRKKGCKDIASLIFKYRLHSQ